MSKDIVVLTPNARRVTVHCTPDTSILQVLEDVCKKHGLEAGDYDLKHHNKIIDLTTTIRYSNLPNRACLEMVEASQHRKESNVIIGLQLGDGERRTGEFPPSTSLYEVVSTLAEAELTNIEHPMVMYMRQEIFGIEAIKEKTLKQIGLLSGRAILKLLNKSPGEPKMQANVSTVYRSKPTPSTSHATETTSSITTEESQAEADLDFAKKTQELDTKTDAIHKGSDNKKNTVDPVKFLKQCMGNKNNTLKIKEVISEEVMDTSGSHEPPKPVREPIEERAMLERRLNIEREVTFIGDHKAIAFIPQDQPEQSIEDLPDDFYTLTVDEVRRLYNDLQAARTALENAPLLTSSKKDDNVKQIKESKLKTYKNVVVRIQFPDNIILQGVFEPNNTVNDINNFIRQHLQLPDEQFNIYSTTCRGVFEANTTLLEANFVPCVLLHFKWINRDDNGRCLRDDIYTNTTNSDAASILASKYRAPARRDSQNSITSASTSNKVPRWFKK